MDWTIVFLAAGAALLILLWINANLQRIEVWPAYVGVILVSGKPKVLKPGQHKVWGKSRPELVFLGPENMWISAQEIQTTDNIAARYSFSLQHHITDPLIALSAKNSYSKIIQGMSITTDMVPLYRAVQAQVRLVLASKSVEEIRERSEEISKTILELLRPEFSKWGRELESIFLMDIQLPASIRNAQHQAETERILAAATLEKARSEVASLRALANAAKMIDDNPNLAVLRKIQAIESLKSGSVRLDLD